MGSLHSIEETLIESIQTHVCSTFQRCIDALEIF